MRQEINLLQESLFDKKVPLSTRWMLILCGLCLALLVMMSLGLSFRQQRLNAEVLQLETEKNRLSTALARYQREHPPAQKDLRLDAELERLRQQLKGRQPLLAHFATLAPQQLSGFSVPLEKLALYPFQNVWLQQLILNPAQNYVQIAGTATSAELVPAYLVHLQTHQIFAGQNFTRMQLTRPPQDSRLLNFQLETRMDAGDEH